MVSAVWVAHREMANCDQGAQDECSPEGRAGAREWETVWMLFKVSSSLFGVDATSLCAGVLGRM